MKINKNHKLTFNDVELNKIYYLHSSMGKISVQLSNIFIFEDLDKEFIIPSSYVYLIDKYIIKRGGSYECFAFLCKEGICSTWLIGSEGIYEVD